MHSTTTSSFPLALALALAAVTFSSCADGGKEDRPQSEVKVRATNHFFSFRTLRGFGAVPVSPSVANTDFGSLELFPDSTWTRRNAQGITSAPESYALETTGEWTLFDSGSGQEPSVAFLGGYGQVSGATDLFFTDRVSTPLSPSIGLFVGTRVVTGQVELGGNWHLVSLHAIFDQSAELRENVGRAAHGSINIAPDSTPGTERAISSQGIKQNVSAQGFVTVPLSGEIQNLLVGESGDGTCRLELIYGTDTRIVQAVATGNNTTGNLVFGLDRDRGAGDGEAGLVFMVRKFDTPIESPRVEGRFLVGGHTLFVKPTNSGSDAFVGVVTLSTQNGFRLEAVGNQGIDFTYNGTYVVSSDGGITISIDGTDETWFAAIDRSYNTLVFIDDFLEVRPNDIPELNIGFGVREKP